ncbi:hypothetical protein [Vibrio parahaemolyticus]|uniref:hypothetical protein n=1 Tax=Vibrio parahaemolyticus TaxID=670 RepID=UPI0009A935B1|nr:hypothetical protein [Vibrio parahaemolyticus]ASO15776.1 hypothetical protein BGM07_016115 [Vibrio parahaemolyticus]AWA89707.1 hypothetical protein BSG32_11860 [Vibrio parahaemolyticus]EGQ7715967.1 hypothetical protein [Vibrio parahaemolyticus]EGQ7721304.1 hypothetical protein [Vibrio parahaemolyticus]EGQ7725124.1 hypothetical protein [Vibrio parahaemolyticus]
MKPLGTNNAAENGLTTPKRAFEKPISQCGLSTNSPNKVATKNRLSIALLCQHQRKKQPLGHLQNFGLRTAETEF